MNARNNVRNLHEKMNYRTQTLLRNSKETLTSLNHHLEKQNPNEPLEKGFTRIWQNEKWIRSIKSFDQQTGFSIEWKDGKNKVG
jgi:exodeoxyribonuclease VII large subunit